MAEIDREAFGLAVLAALEARGLTQARAAAMLDGLDKAMLSRATRGDRMSAGNYVLLCQAFALDPFVFLVARPRLTLKSLARQAVTQADQRETRAGRARP